MNDFIALRCPSCGGNIQTEKNLEKIFCNHCGTQLLLKQGADGLLIPMMARELIASAKLKESQTAMMVADLLKSQIKELEEKAAQIRKAFFEFCYPNVFFYKNMPHLRKTLEAYQMSLGLARGSFAGAISACIVVDLPGLFNGREFTMDYEKLLARNTPGFNTADDLLNIYQYISQAKNFEKGANQLALILQPITQIVPELQKKKQELKKALDSVTG